MQAFLIAIHVITCIILVITVLLQQGKGAEVGAVFGSSEAIFGSAGPATLLSKITTACAIIFMLTSLSLTYLSIQNRGQSVMTHVKQVPVAPPSLPTQAMPGANGKAKVDSSRVTPSVDKQKLNGQSATRNAVSEKEDLQKGLQQPADRQNSAPDKGAIPNKTH